MSPTRYDELTVDGVRGLIYDREAVHNSEFVQVLTNAISAASVKAALLDFVFRVGSYHITADNTNPGGYLGGR